MLLESLNKTKASSMTIAESLQDAHRIQTTLDQVRINPCQEIYVQNKLIFCLFKKSSARYGQVDDCIWLWTFQCDTISLFACFTSDVSHGLTAYRLVTKDKMPFRFFF